MADKKEQEILTEEERTEGEETLEELFAKLDEVTGKLESGEATLEESFRLYQNGMEMLKKCNDKIDKVEKQVLILEENGETHEF
ncbi:MAG: exodeoxyribonuclease VII small subunit [Bariatricus sp.]|nr:exodeoxyribonuclease VII small subunit [Bariatricus sp.]